MEQFLGQVNLLFLIFVVMLIAKAVDGANKGMVKQIVSLFSFTMSAVVLTAIALGLRNYSKKDFVQLTIAFMIVFLIGIVRHILNLVFFSAKMISKLPVIKSVDKLLGVAVGLLEVVLAFWTLYAIIMIFDLSAFEKAVMEFTRENNVLSWLYQNNYLAKLVYMLSRAEVLAPKA